MDEQVIVAATALTPNVMAVMNLATLSRTVPTRFICQECHATHGRSHTDTPSTRGTDHAPIMAPDIGDISAGHGPALIPTHDRSSSFRRHTSCSSSSHHSGSHHHSANGHSCYPSHCDIINIIALHLALTTSPLGTTHATQWTGAGLARVAPAMQHKNLSL